MSPGENFLFDDEKNITGSAVGKKLGPDDKYYQCCIQIQQENGSSKIYIDDGDLEDSINYRKDGSLIEYSRDKLKILVLALKSIIPLLRQITKELTPLQIS